MSTRIGLSIVAVCLVFLVMFSGCLFPFKADWAAISVEDPNWSARNLSIALIYDLDAIRAQPDGRPAGLVVYSLGYSACISSAETLSTLFAEQGYVFAVPDHNDVVKLCQSIPEDSDPEELKRIAGELETDPGVLSQFSGLDAEKQVSEEQLEAVFAYRNADLVYTVQHLTGSDAYPFGSLAGKPVYLVGYSLGGWNVLNVAGAGAHGPETSCEISAAICLNSFVGGLCEERIRRIGCPVLHVVGTDDVLCPEVHQLFDWRRSNSRLVEIEGADHYLFAVDLCSSPVLSAWQPNSCADCNMSKAAKANELVVDFVESMTESGAIPRMEELASYDPSLFKVSQ